MNSMTKTLFGISTAAFLLMAQSSISFANTVYKWTDERGQVHYSQQPPENYKSERIQTNSIRSFGQNIEFAEETKTPSTANTETTTTTDADTEETNTSAAPAKVEKDSALCAKAQESKKMLISVPIIRRQGKVMTVEEKNAELQYIEDIIRVNC